MLKIETYYIDEHERPTLEDVKEAFEIAKINNIIVELKWYVPYSGTYARCISPDDVKNMSPETYFKEIIPHMYGV